MAWNKSSIKPQPTKSERQHVTLPVTQHVYPKCFMIFISKLMMIDQLNFSII